MSSKKKCFDTQLKFIHDFLHSMMHMQIKKKSNAFVEIVAVNQIMNGPIYLVLYSNTWMIYVIYLYEMHKKICKNKEQDFHADADKHMDS